VVNYARLPGALETLARELLEMEATGDRSRVEKWLGKYDTLPLALRSALNRLSDIPVDIDPLFSFPEPIE
jgi:hypothetical protein